MRVQELEGPVLGGDLHQPADPAEPVDAVGECEPAGAVDVLRGVPLPQRAQTHQHADRQRTAVLDERMSPLAALQSHPRRLLEPVVEAVSRGELPQPARQARGEGALRQAREHLDLLEPLVVYPHHPRVPAHPHPPADILLRQLVIGPSHLDAAVLVHGAPPLVEAGEEREGERLQRRLLVLLEPLPHLHAGRPVDPRVGHRRLPVPKEPVLLAQAPEQATLERVVLDVIDAALHLALVLRVVRARGDDDRAVVPGELLHLGVQLGIEPVGVPDGGLQVVDPETGGDASERPERVLQAPDERLGRLARDGLAVALPGEAQRHPQNVRPPSPARLPLQDGRPLAEVHLRLLAGKALHAVHASGMDRAQAPHIALHRLVGAREAVLHHKVLVDPLGGQTRLERVRY